MHKWLELQKRVVQTYAEYVSDHDQESLLDFKIQLRQYDENFYIKQEEKLVNICNGIGVL